MIKTIGIDLIWAGGDYILPLLAVSVLNAPGNWRLDRILTSSLQPINFGGGHLPRFMKRVLHPFFGAACVRPNIRWDFVVGRIPRLELIVQRVDSPAGSGRFTRGRCG